MAEQAAHKMIRRAYPAAIVVSLLFCCAMIFDAPAYPGGFQLDTGSGGAAGTGSSMDAPSAPESIGDTIRKGADDDDIPQPAPAGAPQAKTATAPASTTAPVISIPATSESIESAPAAAASTIVPPPVETSPAPAAASVASAPPATAPSASPSIETPPIAVAPAPAPPAPAPVSAPSPEIASAPPPAPARESAPALTAAPESSAPRFPAGGAEVSSAGPPSPSRVVKDAAAQPPVESKSGESKAAAEPSSRKEVASAEKPSTGLSNSPFAAMSVGSGHGPIDIKSDTMSFDYKDKSTVFKGHVHAAQANGELTCNTLKVIHGADLNDIKETIADGNVRISQGTKWVSGDHAVMNQAKQTVILTGNPVAHDGSDQIAGSRITVHLDSGKIEVEGARVVIFPRQSQPADNTNHTN